MCIIQLFCDIDDLFIEYQQKAFQPLQDTEASKKRNRPSKLHKSEVMTILVVFHQSGYSTFKQYYLEHVQKKLRWAFPHLVSYSRFLELKREILEVLMTYLATRYASSIGTAFIDSTRLPVCDNRRISQHRVFANNAARGKTSVGWFYGFKLHLVINDKGELLATQLTPGNIDDRKPVLELTKHLEGKLYGNKGYISKKLSETLETRDVCLLTKVRKNMQPPARSELDAALLRHRMLIETVIGQLKSETQIQHTRHRSWINYQVNMVAALIAYTYRSKKPSIDMVALREKYK